MQWKKTQNHLKITADSRTVLALGFRFEIKN